ncbi:hypothetical protein KKF91_17010, partial [Myxococcota bacterium]|nr:hypothetical protein [Myxococcota bacterium]
PPTPDPPPPAPEAPTVTLAPSLKGEAKAEAEGRPLERDALEENATSTGPQGASPSPHEAKAPKARRVAKGAKAAPRRRARSRGRDADRDADRDAEHERARRFAPPPSMGGDAAPPPSPQRVEPVAAPSAHTPSAPARPAIAPSEPAAPTREDEMSARGAKRQDEALADERPFDVAKDDLAVGDVVEDVEPRAALEAGLGALARGEHQSAWALLDAFLRAHPTHPRADEARFGAGQAAEALGWWSIARAAYAQIKAAPWAERAKARLDALRASPP